MLLTTSCLCLCLTVLLCIYHCSAALNTNQYIGTNATVTRFVVASEQAAVALAHSILFRAFVDKFISLLLATFEGSLLWVLFTCAANS